MFVSRSLNTFILASLLIPSFSCAESALKIKDGKAQIDFFSVGLTEPMSDFGAGALGGIGGGIVGAIVGAGADARNQGQNATVGGVIGLVVGAGVVAYMNSQYRKMYNKSEGYNLHGVAARNNAEGVKAQVAWYTPAKTLEQDSEGRTPLMFASATGSDRAAQALLNAMPECHEFVDGKTETTSVAQKTSSGWAAAADVTLGTSWYKAPEKTETTTVSLNKKTIPAIDMQDKQRNTALLYAAICEKPDTVKLLLEHGADGSRKNNLGQDVGMIGLRKPAIQKALDDRAEGR
jgi:hypothetical protein